MNKSSAPEMKETRWINKQATVTKRKKLNFLEKYMPKKSKSAKSNIHNERYKAGRQTLQFFG